MDKLSLLLVNHLQKQQSSNVFCFKFIYFVSTHISMSIHKVNKLEAEKSHINNLILISFRLTKV